jgi:autotransporter-associated beta strand protein
MRLHSITSLARLAGVLALASFLAPARCAAASGTWTNLNGGSWTNTANWSGGIIASNLDAVANFSALNLLADATVSLDRARTIGGLVFADTTPDRNWTLNTGSGGALTLAVSSGTPAITVSNQNATLAVLLAGTQGLLKNGAGGLTLAAANSFTGPTTVSEGNLTLVNPVGYKTTALAIAPGATLTLDNSSNGAAASSTAGNQYVFNSAKAVLSGAGTLNFVGAGGKFYGAGAAGGMLTCNLSPGAQINFQGGSWQWGWTHGSFVTNQAGVYIAAGAEFRCSDALSQMDALTGFGVLGNAYTGPVTFTLGANQGSGTFYGAIVSGDTYNGTTMAPVSIVKVGLGTQVLSGTNTYTGATTVSNGTLALGPNGSIASSTPITIAPGALFDVSAPGFTLGAGQSLAAGRSSSFANDILGSLTNSGTLNIGAAGAAATLTLSSNLCLAGGTINFDLAYSNSVGASVNDLLAVGGNVSLTGSTTLNLNALAGALQTGKTYTLLTCAGTLSGGVTNLALAGYSFIANSQGYSLAVGAGAITLTVLPSQVSVPPVLPYVVAPSPWPIDQRGNVRALLAVTQAVDAIRVDLPWRRRDSNPQNKNIVVVDAATGAVIANQTAVNLTREFGSIVFQPQTVPGNYYLYYMPFTDSQNIGSYSGGYVSAQSTASSTWLSSNGLPASATSLPAAVPVQFEARLPIDNFWPMEVPMTVAEKTAFLAANPGGYLLFPEDRLHPIKMRDELPYRWLAAQPANTLADTALRDEYFAFQLGLYAVTQSVQNVRVTFSDLLPTGGGASIPASAFNCLNLAGTNWDGAPLTNAVTVAQGAIQPLWLGLLIPPAAVTGLYTGTITVSADNAPSKVVNLALTVDGALAVNHGDDDPQKQSRLRWMDSQLAANDELIPPYTAMTLSNQTVGVLGRGLTFTNLGLPASIRAGTNEILQSPVQFSVEIGGVPVAFSAAPTVTLTNAGRVAWQATATAGGLTLQSVAQMEFDGHLSYTMTLSATSATTLSDVKLKIPLTAAASTYMAGIGYNGDLRPSAYSWSWSTPHNSVWLGGVHAGLHTKLLGATYTGPLLNLYHPAAPPTWGGGSVTVSNSGSGALLQANTGGKSLSAGAQVQYQFALLLTPVKPIDPALQFGDRYYHADGNHDVSPPSDWKDYQVNVINVHHANWVNPNINWPFTQPDVTTGFVTNYQAQGAKVKLYYTVREVTQYPPELWALRSLGHEVFTSGGGGGFPWLQEHLLSDYSVAWYMPLTNGTYDAATTTSPNSRWFNYYVEGVNWLANNDQIDGLYLDDVSYDRVTLKRVRRVLKQANPGSRIDMHSNTGFSLGPINQYAEFLPYLDRLWLGESFNYNSMTPEQWLVQCTGIPFGPMAEMLQGGGNPWLGALFGLTCRYGWSEDPRPTWRIWDQFGGLTNAAMRGWWEANPVVTASDSNVKATAFVKNGKTLLAVGNFSSSQLTVTLNVNWAALGLDSNSCTFYAPPSSGFQGETLYQPADAITIPGKQGFMFIVQPGNTNSGTAPANALLAQYRMSETSGTNAIDDTGNFPGQYVGAPVLGGTNVPAAAEASLRSVSFSGGQWMELPSALADLAFRSNSTWAISFWARPALPSGSYNATFAWMDAAGSTVSGILFYLEGNGSLDFWIGDGSTWNNWPNYNPGTGLQDRWYHVAASFDGATLRAYLDGQLVKTVGIGSFVVPAAGRPITVGLRPGSSPAADMHGRMTDLRLYRGVLSAQDIQSLFTYPGRHVAADAAGNSAYSTFAVGMAGGTNLLLSIPAVASWQYQEQASQDLASTNWTAIGPILTSPPAGLSINITNDMSAFPQRYYRMQITH